MFKNHYWFLRFNLKKISASTAFILNLAFSDLMYCIFNFSIITFEHIATRWKWGKVLCLLFVNIRYSNCYSAWMSVSMVALTRCITVSKLGKTTFLSMRRNRLVICLIVRIASIVILLPSNLGVRIRFCNWRAMNFINNVFRFWESLDTIVILEIVTSFQMKMITWECLQVLFWIVLCYLL